MPHKAMRLVTETNLKAGEQDFWNDDRRTGIAEAQTLADVGEKLGLSSGNQAVVGHLDQALEPASVQKIIEGFQRAAKKYHPDTVQVVWIENEVEDVEVGGGDPDIDEPGLVSIIVRSPAFELPEPAF